MVTYRQFRKMYTKGVQKNILFQIFITTQIFLLSTTKHHHGFLWEHLKWIWKIWSIKLILIVKSFSTCPLLPFIQDPVMSTGAKFSLSPVWYALERQITWQISHSSGSQQTVIQTILPWCSVWGVEALWNISRPWPLRAPMWFCNPPHSEPHPYGFLLPHSTLEKFEDEIVHGVSRSL